MDYRNHVIVQFSIVPVGGGESLKTEIAAVLDEVRRSGLPHQFGPMATVVEGPWSEVMALIERCHRLARSRTPRVYTSVTIDDRAGAKGRIRGKVRDVEALLNGPHPKKTNKGTARS